MKTVWKGALAALAFAGAAAAATAPANAQDYGLTYGPGGGISFSYNSGGYCDDYGCPADFWDMPVYYGPVFWQGDWYDGPLYYRDWYGRREYWIQGDWRFDEWRGPHPGWWREGRYGPALGADFYSSHGFHGAWDRHDDWHGGFAPRDDHGGYSQGYDRGGPSQNYNRGGDPRAMDQRSFDQHSGDQRGPQGYPGYNRGPQAPQGYPAYNRGPQPQAARPAPQPAPQPQQQGRGRSDPRTPPAPGTPAPDRPHYDRDNDRR